MSSINNTLAGLEFAQIGWVVPDIQAAVKFLASTLGIAGFPQPQHVRAQDLDMTYHGRVVAGDWLTTQTYNGGTFIELVQPLSGQSMFHDYLAPKTSLLKHYHSKYGFAHFALSTLQRPEGFMFVHDDSARKLIREYLE